MRGLVVATAAAILAAASAGATRVYSNDFDTENNGASAGQYAGFRGLTVTYPSVDLVHTGDGSGVTCAGGQGGCVDLDGGRSGQLLSDTFGFNAGDVVTLSFSASGSQRASSPLDDAAYFFEFDQETSGSYVFASDFGAYDAGAFDDYGLGEVVEAPYDLGFHNVTFTFTPLNAGTFRFGFDDYTPSAGDDDDDGAGRVIDNVALDVSPVPEPAAWATMTIGFGIAGGVLRRRARTGAGAARLA